MDLNKIKVQILVTMDVEAPCLTRRDIDRRLLRLETPSEDQMYFLGAAEEFVRTWFSGGATKVVPASSNVEVSSPQDTAYECLLALAELASREKLLRMYKDALYLLPENRQQKIFSQTSLRENE